MRGNKYIKLGDAISQMFKEENLEEKYSVFAVRNAWKEIAGDLIARHTREIRYHKKVLFVVISSDVIRNELSYNKKDLIEKINKFCGKRLVEELILK
ncbi:MAG: DUF721 domain-containing protein [Bacteroidetes bacterium]|nr:DUF721 domain-containing protein [Bacteroidota bacterium]